MVHLFFFCIKCRADSSSISGVKFSRTRGTLLFSLRYNRIIKRRRYCDDHRHITKELFVLALSYQGMTIKAIATIMGIGESRVQQIKRKALLRVKLMWRDYNHD